MNVYEVIVNGNTWNVEASTYATAIQRGVKAADRARKSKGLKGIDALEVEVKVFASLKCKNATLAEWKKGEA